MLGPADLSDAALARLASLARETEAARAAYLAVPDLNARIEANPRDPVALEVCWRAATANEALADALNPTTILNLLAELARRRAADAGE